MAKEKLTPADLDARLKFILGITLGSILFMTALGIIYGLLFVTQPIGAQSENDKMFFNVLGSIATFITGTLAGILIGNSGIRFANDIEVVGAMLLQIDINRLHHHPAAAPPAGCRQPLDRRRTAAARSWPGGLTASTAVSVLLCPVGLPTRLLPPP